VIIVLVVFFVVRTIWTVIEEALGRISTNGTINLSTGVSAP